MKNQYQSVMIDLETMGNNSRSPILSIGAVAFDPMGIQPVSTLPTFYRNVKLESCMAFGLAPDASTIMWWLGQSEEARAALTTPLPTDLTTALSDFYYWFKETGAEDLWAHATFDPVIMKSAALASSMSIPWSHRNVRDIRTLVALGKELGFEPPASGSEGRNDLVKHTALGDAQYQVGYVRFLYQAVIGDRKKAPEAELETVAA